MKDVFRTWLGLCVCVCLWMCVCVCVWVCLCVCVDMYTCMKLLPPHPALQPAGQVGTHSVQKSLLCPLRGGAKVHLQAHLLMCHKAEEANSPLTPTLKGAAEEMTNLPLGLTLIVLRSTSLSPPHVMGPLVSTQDSVLHKRRAKCFNSEKAWGWHFPSPQVSHAYTSHQALQHRGVKVSVCVHSAFWCPQSSLPSTGPFSRFLWLLHSSILQEYQWISTQKFTWPKEHSLTEKNPSLNFKLSRVTGFSVNMCSAL